MFCPFVVIFECLQVFTLDIRRGTRADNEVYQTRSVRFCHPERSEGLTRWAERCFAALSMTVPALVVKNHHRRWPRSSDKRSTLPGPLPTPDPAYGLPVSAVSASNP